MSIVKIPLLVLFLMGLKTSGQDVEAEDLSDWNDKTYKTIELEPLFNGERLIIRDCGKHALICVSYQKLTTLCANWIENDGLREAEFQKILSHLDSINREEDTIILGDPNPEFDYLVTELLLNGNAVVYDRTSGKKIDTISHRLEKYGTQAYRFFYLPNGLAFFAQLQLIGIIEDGEDQLQSISSRRKEYIELANRLRKIGC